MQQTKPADGRDSCVVCGSPFLTRGQLPAGSTQIELFACEECGEFWFERDTQRLEPDPG